MNGQTIRADAIGWVDILKVDSMELVEYNLPTTDRMQITFTLA